MGFGDRTVEVPLLSGERILAQGFGGAGHKAGGKLFVTNLRVLFQPWDLTLANRLIKWGCKALQVPHAGAVTWVVGKAKNVVDATAQGIGDLVAVEPVGMASALNAPKIRLTKSDGTVAEFGAVATTLTPSGFKENNVARDNLVAVIQQTLLVPQNSFTQTRGSAPSIDRPRTLDEYGAGFKERNEIAYRHEIELALARQGEVPRWWNEGLDEGSRAAKSDTASVAGPRTLGEYGAGFQERNERAHRREVELELLKHGIKPAWY